MGREWRQIQMQIERFLIQGCVNGVVILNGDCEVQKRLPVWSAR